MDAEKLRNLKLRSELFRAIRAFFYDAGYIEVETPVKIHAPAPEEYIESVPRGIFCGPVPNWR